MLSSIFKPASCAIEPLMEAASTSCNKRGACADSASMISKLRGLLVMSANEAFVPTPSFNVIKPSVCNATNARPWIATSLGTNTFAFSGKSFNDLYFVEK